jgi:type II secretory pathway pseudopilin PulG
MHSPRTISGVTRNTAPAFTLLELLLVLGLLIALAGMAWPRMQSHFKATELSESAQRMRTALFMARSDAVLTGRRHRIRFATGDKQPFVEFEPNPLTQPGVYELVTADWMDDDLLLGDSEVYSIQPGRPDFMKPVQPEPAPETPEEPAAAEVSQPVSGGAPRSQLQSKLAGDEPTDVNRPPISFEADGTTGWATIVIAAAKPGEPLEEGAKELWIIVDGRTGMATIRQPVTEQDYADPTFLVHVDKLQVPLPDDAMDGGTLLTMPAMGAPGAQGGQGFTPPPAVPKLGQMTGEAMQSAAGGKPSGGALSEPVAPSTGIGSGLQPEASEGNPADQAEKGDATANPEDATEDPDKAADPKQDEQSELDKALANSDLTEEQKAEIKKAFEKDPKKGNK